jgi:DNA invertase Pin-like site-specific DNA recombinase
MAKVFYSRVSSTDNTQRHDRQLQNLKDFDYVLTDNCSGAIPLFERPKGKQIKKMMDDGNLEFLSFHDPTRIGRNTLDVLTIWSDFTQRGIIIECKNPYLRNINEDGTVDKLSELMMSILATMSQFERSLIKERQMEGIRLRQAKGLYMGRKINTQETPEKHLQKERSIKILDYLKKGTYTAREVAAILNTSTATITKTKKIAEEMGML